jgi:ribonuclease P protein component
VRQTGTRIRVDDLDVRAAVTERGTPRVGFVVPKYKHSAVDRNRLKRRLRELVRTRVLPEWEGIDAAARGVDIVVRALPSAYRISMAELAARIDRVVPALRRRITAPDVE